MIVVALVAGYLIGALPTAQALGRLWGVDLRREGSTNPGTFNSLRLSGPSLAGAVLAVEAAKGYGAVVLGQWMADDAGAIAAGIGAVAGNVYNLWYRFQGGKGLGISLGVLIAAWPLSIPVAIGGIVLAVALTRSSGKSAIAAMITLVVSAIVWSFTEWPTGGVAPTTQLIWLAAGMSGLMFPRHWRDVQLKRAGLL